VIAASNLQHLPFLASPSLAWLAVGLPMSWKTGRPSWPCCCWPGLQMIPPIASYERWPLDGAAALCQDLLRITCPCLQAYLLAWCCRLPPGPSLGVFDLIVVLTRGGLHRHPELCGLTLYSCHAAFLDFADSATVMTHVWRAAAAGGVFVAVFCAVLPGPRELPPRPFPADFFVKHPTQSECLLAVCTTIASQRVQNPRR